MEAAKKLRTLRHRIWKWYGISWILLIVGFFALPVLSAAGAAIPEWLVAVVFGYMTVVGFLLIPCIGISISLTKRIYRAEHAHREEKPAPAPMALLSAEKLRALVEAELSGSPYAGQILENLTFSDGKIGARVSTNESPHAFPPYILQAADGWTVSIGFDDMRGPQILQGVPQGEAISSLIRNMTQWAQAQRRAKEAAQAEEARRAEEARQAEEAQQAEEARRAEEARQAEEARRAKIRRQVDRSREMEAARRAAKTHRAEKPATAPAAKVPAEKLRRIVEAELSGSPHARKILENLTFSDGYAETRGSAGFHAAASLTLLPGGCRVCCGWDDMRGPMRDQHSLTQEAAVSEFVQYLIKCAEARTRAEAAQQKKANTAPRTGKPDVSAMQPLFGFWVDDADRAMAGTQFSYYWDEKTDKIYVTGSHSDAASFHGSSLSGPDEVTKEAALAKAAEHCPEKLAQIKKLLEKNTDISTEKTILKEHKTDGQPLLISQDTEVSILRDGSGRRYLRVYEKNCAVENFIGPETRIEDHCYPIGSSDDFTAENWKAYADAHRADRIKIQSSYCTGIPETDGPEQLRKLPEGREK